MNLKDIYDSPNEKLSEEEFNFLISRGYTFNYNTTMNICSNYELFCNSLYNDYDKTIDCILCRNFKNVTFDPMSDITSEVILNKLIDVKFVLETRNLRLMEYNPLFLVASLNNDYDKTIDVLAKCKKNFVVNGFDRENRYIEEILVKNRFCLNKNNINIINNSPSFLLASFKMDCVGTLKTLKLLTGNISNISNEEIRKIMDILFVENDISFNKLPVVVKNVVAKYLNEYIYSDVDSEFVKNLVKKGKIPLSYFDSEVLYANYDLLSSGLNDGNVIDFLYSRVWSYSFYRFNYKDEITLINLLGKKYRGCSCVEDVLKRMHFCRLTRDKMSILEMFALQLYGAKELKKIGCTSFVNVFNFKDEYNQFGTNDRNSVNVNINALNNKVINMVNTLHHEIEHCVQQKNTDNSFVNRDRDLIVYYKDEILRKIIGNSYYKENYKVFLSEFDAEVKAYIKTCKLFGLIDSRYSESKQSIIKKAEKAVNLSLSKIENYRDFNRCVNGNEYTLNNLFERKMNILKNDDNDKYLSYINSYPIIRYEYKYDDCFERKTIEELIKDFVGSDDNKVKGVYYNLLRSRIDVNKEDRSSVENNIEILHNLYHSDYYKESVKKVIFRLISEYNSNNNESKYKGYFYRINKSK